MTIRPLATTFAAAALFLLVGCEEQTAGSASPQPSAVPNTSTAPTTGSSSSSAPTASASRPSAASVTASPATKPATGPVAHTPDGAAGVMEEFHHALGAKDLDVVCRISAPAYDGGMKECRSLTPMLFEMLTAEDLKNLKATKVNRAKVQSKGPDQVTVPPTAIAPKATIMDGDAKTFTMAWRGGTWVIIE
ncbi:hypothetical protein [Amycolatopsis sp. lyj-112]|uniref:hypothetical protein n=1 Tax=Amycolatopsis sp. lyj-112 TaxID=2789288 RepID=UPI00397852F9